MKVRHTTGAAASAALCGVEHPAVVRAQQSKVVKQRDGCWRGVFWLSAACRAVPGVPHVEHVRKSLENLVRATQLL